MAIGEYHERGSLATCRGCGNLHINPATGMTYCSAEECVRLMHTKASDAKDQDTKEVIPVDWIVDYLKAEVDKGFKSDPFLVAYGMIILAAWRKETGEV